MKTFKGQKGITLVALVITIIVLLILAVVAIGAVRDSGIIGHAQNSADKYNTGKADENTKIGEYEDAISKYYNGGSFGTSGAEKGSVTYKDGVPIPSGFYYVTGTKDTGFVISDDKSDENKADGRSGNQFVWVPVTEDISTTEYISGINFKEPEVVEDDSVAANLERAECKDINRNRVLESEDFKTELTNMYKAMAESVNKYDGFYVGRYETSRNGANPQSKYGAISAYNSSTENDWYGLYALNKKYKTSSVQSSMIWGIQYDKMMNWMGEIADSSTWKEKRNANRTCGTESNDVIKNVYDIWGNSFEWTMESGHQSSVGTWCEGRALRGGAYSIGDVVRPSSRTIIHLPGYLNGRPTKTDSAGRNGSRLALYITVGFDNLDEEIEIPEEELGEVPDSMIGEKFGFVDKDDSGKQEHDYYVFNKDYTGTYFDDRYEDSFTFALKEDGTGTLTMDEKNKVYEITFKVLKDSSGNIINKIIILDDNNEYDNTWVYTTNGSTGLQKLEDTRYKAYDGEELMGYFVFDGESVKANPIGTDEMIDIGFGDYFVYGNYIYVSEENNNIYWSAYRIEGDTIVSLGN